MNKSYRSIWNEALGAWVAVSEIETAKGKPVGSSENKGFRSAFRPIVKMIPWILGFALTLPVSAYAAEGTLNCKWGGNIQPGPQGQPNTGAHNITCGFGASGDFDQSVAIGVKAKAPGRQSVALGGDAIAQGHASVSIGGDDLSTVAGNNNRSDVAQVYNRLTGDQLFTRYISTKAQHGGVAVGVSAEAADLGTAFGTRAKASGLASMALGTGSHADKENAIAIGAGSTTAGTTAVGISNMPLDGNKQPITAGNKTAPAYYRLQMNGIDFDFQAGNSVDAGDIVSFGAAGFERQLKHVAPGQVARDSTDAINGSQLYTVVNELTRLRGNVTTVDGNVTNLQNSVANLESAKTHYFSVHSSDQSAESNYNNGGATGENALAVGVRASATGHRSVAVGNAAKAIQHETVAIGTGAEANQTGAVAVANG